MSDFLDIRTWSILQWVLVVLAAGFIGQFGKSFATFIIAKVKDRRAAGRKAAKLPAPGATGGIMPETPATLPVPAGTGIMKGATIPVPTESEKIVSGITSAPFAKMEEAVLPSLEDRAGQRREAGEHGLPSTVPGQSAAPVVDKKALKTILKQQKKTAKSSAKASK